MKQKRLDFLEANQSKQPSTFIEDAKWRQENKVWLKWSRTVALSIADYMQANELSRSDVAAKLGVSPQYVSQILSGKTNFSLKSLAEIEKRLGISCAITENSLMSENAVNTIEYLVLIISEFARQCKISEQDAYEYLTKYGAFELCLKHYGVMHTLSVEENLASLTDYCRRRGGSL